MAMQEIQEPRLCSDIGRDPHAVHGHRPRLQGWLYQAAIDSPFAGEHERARRGGVVGRGPASRSRCLPLR